MFVQIFYHPAVANRTPSTRAISSRVRKTSVPMDFFVDGWMRIVRHHDASVFCECKRGGHSITIASSIQCDL